MPLSMEIGLSPNDFVLDGDPAPHPRNGHGPQFSAHDCCGPTAKWIKMPLGRELGLVPGDFVLDGNPAAPSPNRGAEAPKKFRPMFIVAKRLDGSRWHLAWR